MPPRKSHLEELIRTGLVGDGELLRYKSKQGQLLAIGRAREGGIEVAGQAKLLNYTAFEGISGSKYHRPAEHTHTSTSRTLQGLQLLAAGDGGGGGGGGRAPRKEQPEPEPTVELLEDENDDLCYTCGLGGDLVCCETCPAVFHAACLGLGAAPEGDFHCPHCRCMVCGAGGTEGLMPTGCQWVGCQEFVGPSSLQQSARPFAGVPGSSGGGDGDGDAKPEPAAGQEAAPAAEGAEPMQVDGGSADAPAAEVTADFSRLEAACAQRPAGSPPADAAAALPAAQAAAAAAPDGAAVYCPVMARWTHLRCFPPEVAQQLRESGASRSCPSSDAAAESSHALAAACAAGLISLGEVAEGARAAATAGGAAGGSSGSGAPTPLSLLVVRGAAVAAPADCRGHAPAYSPEQRQQLQVALSAALHVLHSCYEPLPDSRTGADMLPWLVRGAVLAGGEADYSGMHTALLYAGQVVVAVAVFRSFGELAELPLLAVRPELQQRNGLGRLLLASVERLLLAAGAQASAAAVLVVPGFAADGAPLLPARLPPPAEGQPPAPPALLQGKWGYGLATQEQSLGAAKHPLVRLPGVLLAAKALAAGTALAPPRLPRRLQWSDAPGLEPRQLLRDGFLAAVATGAPPRPAPPAAARPPQPPSKKAAPKKEAAAVKQEAAPGAAAQQQQAQPQQQQQPLPTPAAVQQQALLQAYYAQQQAMAQQAAAQGLPSLAGAYQQQQLVPAQIQAYQQMLLAQQQQMAAQQQDPGALAQLAQAQAQQQQQYQAAVLAQAQAQQAAQAQYQAGLQAPQPPPPQ